MDFPCHLHRIARRLRAMEPSARVPIAKEQVRTIRELSRRATLLKRELHTLIAPDRPELLAEVGCGTITAAILIGRAAGAERFATDAQFARMAGVTPIPASSGKRERHRLHRSGSRRMNHVLHIIAITRARRDPSTKAYLQRKFAAAPSNGEPSAPTCLDRLVRRLGARYAFLRGEQRPHDPLGGAFQRMGLATAGLFLAPPGGVLNGDLGDLRRRLHRASRALGASDRRLERGRVQLGHGRH